MTAELTVRYTFISPIRKLSLTGIRRRWEWSTARFSGAI